MSSHFLKEAIPVTEQNWAEDIQPVVSVFNWSYNHVNFIRQSIESILEQKTTFPIEIIIHDDASNDGTIEIIREYESKYPRLFRNIIQKENQWSLGKSVMDPLFKAPKGKYIALTHGDDYWTDPYKLHKQVEFLENNEDYVLCATNAILINPLDNKKHKSIIKNINNDITYHLDDFLNKNNLTTCTVVFRNFKISDIKYFSNIPFGDWFLYIHLLSINNSKAIELNFTSGAYRIHSSGVYSSASYTSNLWKYIYQINAIHKYLKIDKKTWYNNINEYYVPLLKKCSRKKKLLYAIKLFWLLKFNYTSRYLFITKSNF